MKAKIVGFQVLDYVSQRTGKAVKGVTLNLTYSHPDFVGANIKSEFVNATSPYYGKIQPLNAELVGKIINIEYVPDKVLNGNMTFRLADIELMK